MKKLEVILQLEIYASKLIDEKVLDKNEVDNLWEEWSEKEKDLEVGKIINLIKQIGWRGHGQVLSQKV